MLSDPNDESLCVARIWEFHHRIGSEGFEFVDFFDGSMNRFTFHFLWCCYALAWGINKYDDHRNTKP